MKRGAGRGAGYSKLEGWCTCAVHVGVRGCCCDEAYRDGVCAFAFREQAEEEESDKAHNNSVCVVLPGRSRVSTPKPAAARRVQHRG